MEWFSWSTHKRVYFFNYREGEGGREGGRGGVEAEGWRIGKQSISKVHPLDQYRI